MTSPGRLGMLLRASAIYDWLALALLLWMPGWLFGAFSHPIPADPFLFRLAALPLWMAPVVYWMAGRDPWGNRPLVTASIRMRFVGGVGIALLLLWHHPPGSMAYWAFVAGDVAWVALILAARRGPLR